MDVCLFFNAICDTVYVFFDTKITRGVLMKGTDRRRELLAWLNENGSLSLTEIVSRFEISKMTAHRERTAVPPTC